MSFDPVERMLAEAVGPVFPAAQLVVVDAGQEVAQLTVGDCEPSTLFDIASLTKPLCTATLAMRAVDGGMSLEEEVRPGVTLWHLLSHSSGLPAWKRLGSTRDQIVAAARSEPLERAPGERSVYSDLGFILLGDALERRLGRPLDAEFADALAAPLGVGTTFHPDATACAPTEGGLRGVVHDDNARAMGGVAGHAGLFSTARDVSTLAGALVAAWADRPGPHRVVPETVRAFFTPCGVPGSTWCLGFDRPSAVGSSAGERWPRSGVGHLGFTGCSLWIDPQRARWVVLLSNRVHPSRANEAIKGFRPALHDAVWDALSKP